MYLVEFELECHCTKTLKLQCGLKDIYFKLLTVIIMHAMLECVTYPRVFMGKHDIKALGGAA